LAYSAIRHVTDVGNGSCAKTTGSVMIWARILIVASVSIIAGFEIEEWASAFVAIYTYSAIQKRS